MMTPSLQSFAFLVWLLSAAAFSLGGLLVFIYLRWGWRLADPIARHIGKSDIQRIVSGSLASFGKIHRRLWAALLMGLVWPAIYAAPLLLLGGLLWVFGAIHHPLSLESGGNDLADFNDWTWYGKLGFYLIYFSSCAVLLIAVVQQFRLVNRARQGGRLTWSDVSDEFDHSVGVAGVLSAALFGGCMLGCVILWLWMPGSAGAALASAVAIPAAAGWAAGILAGFAALWIFHTPIFTMFALLALRDPGWLSAAEAGVGMLRIRPRESMNLAIRGLTMLLTVYRWPAMLWMVLEFAEDQMPVLSVLLREKRPEDIEKQLNQDAPARSIALQGAFRTLEQGRYLDALNQFQIAYSKNIHLTDALEGVAMAQARIGNVLKAREAIERILAADPLHARAAQLMSEIHEGLWNEGGALFEEAHQKCKQPLGRGVTSLDMIGKTNLPPP